MKPQHQCFGLTRLRHQGPDPDQLLLTVNTHATRAQKGGFFSNVVFLSISFLQPFHPTPSSKALFGTYLRR